jgi:transmembrane sensor
MNRVVRLRSQTDIEEAAAVWVWRHDSGSLNDLQRQEFQAWLSLDPRHRRAFEQLSRTWDQLGDLTEPARGWDSAMAQAKQPLLSRRRLWSWSLAASVLLCLSIGAIWLSQRTESQTLSTAVGQRRNFTLADGSVVALNTNSVVLTELHIHTREIYLQKGEAHFQVAHDASRPFLVHAGDTVVRAVGTQFDVRVHGDHKVDVVVDEGRVEVQLVPSASNADAQPRKQPAVAAVRALTAGEGLSTHSPTMNVVPVSSWELANALAWRDGAVVFDGQSLADAVAEIGRYTDIVIVVNDPAAAAMRVGGRFETDDLPSVFAALQEALPITIHSTESGVVYIDSRP